MTEAPVVDVVILTWNDGEDAQRAVESALLSTSVALRVIVIDNGSTAPFALSADRVSVHRSPVNLGVGGGRNMGCRLGSAPFVCFLDSDATIAPTTLELLVQPLVHDNSLALAAPVYVGQPPEIGAGAVPSVWRKIARGLNLTDRYKRTRGSETTSWDVEFAIGACQVVRRSALEDIGGIDDRDRFGPEDLDMCLRLTARGWNLVQVGNAYCDHVARRSSRRILSKRGRLHALAVVRHYLRHRNRNRR